jgi:hypothetical protein
VYSQLTLAAACTPVDCRDELSYALLSWLYHGNSQLVILCFGLLRLLGPQLMEIHALATIEDGATFGLAAMHTCLTRSDYRARSAPKDHDSSQSAASPVGAADFISSCHTLRVDYGDWAERVIHEST